MAHIVHKLIIFSGAVDQLPCLGNAIVMHERVLDDTANNSCLKVAKNNIELTVARATKDTP